MIQIAHLSDIHFGNRFNKATWYAVVDAVVRFDPDFIVISGDLVDDPSPGHLLAAKCALLELSERARAQSKQNGNDRRAELIIVPGNHDVFESGLAAKLPRLDWFERVFHVADTSAAETALKAELNVGTLGFDANCLGYAANTRPQDAGLIRRGFARFDALIAGRKKASWTTKRGFTDSLVAPQAASVVTAPTGSPVLFALLDSNPSHAGFEAATGFVDNDQLISLQSTLDKIQTPYVARIAVVHHHVLPIAFASGAAKVTGEPMMVLRNAGAVLRILADHKFDLILHGHWHKSQFARIDFGSDDRDSYPMAVASAGSCAMVSNDNTSANSINLITIAQNGRIEVKSLDYGAGQAPNANGVLGRHYRLYKEPLSATKRRAYARARERHCIEYGEREQCFEITENGDLWVEHRVVGLQVVGNVQYSGRPFSVSIPTHGHFVRETLELDPTSMRAGFTIRPADQDAGVERYWINLPGDGLRPGDEPVSYAIEYGCANCMVMTRWEARERTRGAAEGLSAPAGFDTEWVGVRVGAPIGKLRLKLKYPESLLTVQPYVECRRPPGYPKYDVDRFGDVEQTAGTAVIDLPVQIEEQGELRYEAATQTWCLEVDRPIVGYRYSLAWKVPGRAEDTVISGSTREWQRILLKLSERRSTPTPAADDRDAVKQFDLLCKTLGIEVCRGGGEENWFVTLYAYESESLTLRPILSCRSWTTEELPQGFKIPYGGGVTGAAFQQRRIIAWSRQPVNEDLQDSAPSLIAPDPTFSADPVEIVNILALPVYHSGSEDLRRPPPWATIGVVTIGSSSYASTFSGLDDAQRRRLRSAAQTQMDSIVQVLLR
jgi:3',5'-cyclic AMP phosphodiesterase CpdA